MTLRLRLLALVAFGGAVPVSAQGLLDSARTRLAKIDGQMDVAGLDSADEVRADRWGVPHIYAKTVHDLFFAQGFVAVVLLEITNYLEHYGLERREIGPGRYETVGPQHSWNSSHLVSNAYLFNLARHSDHHFLASRPYEMLRHWDDTVAPQLPAGYPAMLLAALVPPLWFRIMDPRVAAWRQTGAARTAPVARG